VTGSPEDYWANAVCALQEVSMFYIRGAAVAALMSLSVSAFGQSCPWSGPVQVKAKISSVTVNGIYYDVQGPNDRRTFSDILANCGAT